MTRYHALTSQKLRIIGYLTIIGIQYDSADAFDDCDCADALLKIRGHPLTIPRTPVHDSADILGDAVEKLRISDADNPRIS